MDELDIEILDDALLNALDGTLPAPRADLVQRDATPRQRLDIIGIEAICSMVAEGSMGPALTKRLEVPFIDFDRWLEDDSRRDAYDHSLMLAADSFVALAEEVITSADPKTLAKANALAAHYKGVAARLNAEKYSEKKTSDGGGAQEVHIHFGIPSRKPIDIN